MESAEENKRYYVTDYDIHYREGITYKITTCGWCACTLAGETTKIIRYLTLTEWEVTENGYTYSESNTWHGKGIQNHPVTREHIAGLDSHNTSLLPIATMLGKSTADIESLLKDNPNIEYSLSTSQTTRLRLKSFY